MFPWAKWMDVRAAVQQQFQIVCDHINSDAFRAELPQNSGDLFHVPVIKAAGGFVKKENRRFDAMADAMATLCFCPLESDMGCLSLNGRRSSRDRISSACFVSGSSMLINTSSRTVSVKS